MEWNPVCETGSSYYGMNEWMNRDLSSGGSAEADSFLVAAAAFRDAITSLTQVVSAETSATANLTTD